jgi:hypothetical protein
MDDGRAERDGPDEGLNECVEDGLVEGPADGPADGAGVAGVMGSGVVAGRRELG